MDISFPSNEHVLAALYNHDDYMWEILSCPAGQDWFTNWYYETNYEISKKALDYLLHYISEPNWQVWIIQAWTSQVYVWFEQYRKTNHTYLDHHTVDMRTAIWHLSGYAEKSYLQIHQERGRIRRPDAPPSTILWINK